MRHTRRFVPPETSDIRARKAMTITTNMSFAKCTKTGRFVSRKEAAELLAKQQCQAAVNNENADPNIPLTTLPLVVMHERKQPLVPRRSRTGALSAHGIAKLASLELAYERERKRTAALSAKVHEERCSKIAEMASLQAKLDSTALEKVSMSKELMQTKEALRNCRLRLASFQTVAARSAAEAALRCSGKARFAKNELTTSSAVLRQPQARGPSILCIPPAIVGGRQRYDWVRKHEAKLRDYFASMFSDGPEGESALEVLSSFLQHRINFTADLLLKLEVPQGIEAEICRFLQQQWSPDKCAALRMNAGLTRRGYKEYSRRTFGRWDERLRTWLPVTMPYGNPAPRPASSYKVEIVENKICDDYGLKQDGDGMISWCDTRKVLERRLAAIPEEQLPSDEDSTKVWFGADSYRAYKAFSTKMTMCAAKPTIERKSKEGKRLEGWVGNSEKNHIRMAIYEGSDSYEEFNGKASIVQEQLNKLRKEPLRVKGREYKVELGLFGDMSFLDSVLGGAGCNSKEPCMLCDVHKSHLHLSKAAFQHYKLPVPEPKDYKRRCKLSHAFGEEYGLTEPYDCEGCGKTINEDGQYAPQTTAQREEHRHSHFSQHHGRPPKFGIDIPNIVACSMHGEHNILAQTWYATVTQNLTDKDKVERVNAIVCDKWNMKRHKSKMQPGNKPSKKDTLHFNGPEGKKVLEQRAEILDIVCPSGPIRILSDKLWAAQDTLFEVWRRPSPESQAGRDAMADEAERVAIQLVRLFVKLTSSSDVTITHHYAMFHWPEHIRQHGSLSLLNAQGLEACNHDGKKDGRYRSNRQTVRTKVDGSNTRGRVAQILANSILRTLNHSSAEKEIELKRHVKMQRVE